MERARAAAVLLVVTLILVIAPRGTDPSHEARAGTAGDRLPAYRGLATWVEMYDSSPYDRPRAAVRKMKQYHVTTLFLETANYRINRG